MSQMSAMMSFALTTAWALHRPVLDSLGVVLARHARGEKLDAGEIAAIVAARDARTSGPQITDNPWYDENSDRAEERGKNGYVRVGSVAHIAIGGVMVKHASMVNGMSQPRGTATETVRRGLANAIADDRNRGGVLHIESPGGSVMGLDELADDIHAARAVFQARGGDIVTVFAGLGASAAYYVGSQASKVYATPSAEIGSIGVYTLMADSTEAWRQAGYRVYRVRSADKKGIGAEGQEITADDLKVVQGNIDDLFAEFKAAVARGRGMTAEQVDAVATGEVWIASKALAKGLIDGIVSNADQVIEELNRSIDARAKSGGTGNAGGAKQGNTPGRASAGPDTPQARVEIAGQALDSAAAGTGAPRQESDSMRLNMLLDPAQPGSGGGGGAAGGTTTPGAAPTAAPNNPGTAGSSDEKVAAEKARVAAIVARAAAFPHNAQIQTAKDAAIAGTTSADAFSAQCLEILAKDAPATGHVAAGGSGKGVDGFDIGIVADEKDKRLDIMTLAMIDRYNPSLVASLDTEKSDTSKGGKAVAEALGFDSTTKAKQAFAMARQANLLGRRRLVDVAAASIAATIGCSLESVHSRFPNDVAFMAAVHERSDFPLLMGRYMNKSLLPAFMEVQTVWDQVCATESTADFKDADVIAFSEAPDLELIINAEMPRAGTFNERGETLLAVDTYAKVFGIDYKAMINDDLGAFNRVATLFVQSAARKPDQLFFLQLAQNSGDGPLLKDGNPLYHSSRSNKFNATALSYANLKADWNACVSRKGFGQDKAPIEVLPDRMVLSFGNALTAEEILTAPYEPGKANQEPNVMRGKLRPLPSMRLTGNRRYYFAPPTMPVFVMRFLNGVRTPTIQELPRNNPRRIEWDISIAGVGCGCTGQHEATATNPGA